MGTIYRFIVHRSQRAGIVDNTFIWRDKILNINSQDLDFYVRNHCIILFYVGQCNGKINFFYSLNVILFFLQVTVALGRIFLRFLCVVSTFSEKIADLLLLLTILIFYSETPKNLSRVLTIRSLTSLRTNERQLILYACLDELELELDQ